MDGTAADPDRSLGGYGALAAGVLMLVRRRGNRDTTALLDAAILAAGLTVPALAFVIVPIAADSSLSLLARLVSCAYPIGDLLVIALLARLVTSRGARSWSYAALAASLAATLAADIWWTVVTFVAPDLADSAWTQALWLSAYVLMAAAVALPSMRDVASAATEEGEEAPTDVDLVQGYLLGRPGPTWTQEPAYRRPAAPAPASVRA